MCRLRKRPCLDDEKVTITQVKNATKTIEKSKLEELVCLLNEGCKAEVQFHHVPIHVGGR